MKHLLSLTAVAAVFLFMNSCQQDQLISPEHPQSVAATDLHRIPRERAIAELNSFLDAIDANDITRGGAPRKIKEIIPVLADNCIETTRMSEDEAAAAIDTLLYLVNFEDENGYAVLSATQYLAPILAVTDSGSTNPEDWKVPITEAGSIFDFDDCCVLDDEEEDDDDGPEPAFPIQPKDSLIVPNPEIGINHTRHNNTTRTAASDEGNHSFEFVRRTICDYCDITLIDRQEDIGNGGGGNSGGGNTGGGNTGGGNNGNTDPAPDPAEWQVVAQVQPMLQTQWHQGYPFNYYCPSKNNSSSSVLQGHAPVGCTAIALGQILAYNQFPKIINLRIYNI